ncbi:hypothetical protein ACTWP5_24735 [Streptomyces sp. 4N509B]|uniref:hypothetical protein n=1 Tax=Streptomyces sp. 4N509B TaxID=3457413 RepID=UPI003FD04317
MTPCPRQHRYAPSPFGAREPSQEPLPDLLGLSLAELRRLDHPVLSAVLDDLRQRLASRTDGMWDFDQGSSGDNDDKKKKK